MDLYNRRPMKTDKRKPFYRTKAVLTAITLLTVSLYSPALYPQSTEQEDTNSEEENNKTSTQNTKIAEKADKIDLSRKTRLSERELKKKKEGHYVTGIAGPAASPDTGYGGTAVLLYYYNGDKEDRLFPYTPYLHNVGLVASYQSKGFTSFAIIWDAPYFLHTPFRLSSELWLNTNPVSQYYGTGETTSGPLRAPDGTTYLKMKDYEKELRTVTAGKTNAFYNVYHQQELIGKLLLQRDFAGGMFRFLTGYLLRHYKVDDYSGKEITFDVDGQRTTAVMNNSKLKEDYLNGSLKGFGGGFINSFVLGLAYDTRDLEPFARKGMFHDISFLFHQKFLGSDYNYTEITSATRFYWSPFAQIDLVLAARLSASYKVGDTPFFSYATIQYTDKYMPATGGMRGFRARRFMGPFITLGNFEARYTFASAKWGEQLFEFSLAPFFDIARSWDDPRDFRFAGWSYSYGGGLRITWNQATVIVFDFGFSREDSGFYLMIRQIF